MSVFPYTETWQLRKPAVESHAGLVVSQHHQASDVGAKVLAQGGNAVDAAVAASFAIGAVEPWMSGMGGGGHMVYRSAKTGEVQCLSFGMVAPLAVDPSHYPLVPGIDSDLFAWPAVVEDRNVKGPHSIAVPGHVAGMALALNTFGSRTWKQSLAPAIALAEEGMAIDWYATLKITGNARDLAEFDESRRTFLPGGYPPSADWASPLPQIKLGRLADTLQRLSDAGPEDFFQGQIADLLVADLQSLGSRISHDDFAAYKPRLMQAGKATYHGTEVYVAPGFTAGPTLHHALAMLEQRLEPAHAPNSDTYAAYVQCLVDAYEHRLSTMGDVEDTEAPGCTTHLCVVDAEGNMVALTQTLLSIFGSRVMLPSTGLLMNNGMMWFDPRPGQPNSIRPGAFPLSNMCPTIVKRSDDRWFALGASGGRRIMPAIFQLLSFLVDFKMPLDEAMHLPRVDFSGSATVTANNRLSASTLACLRNKFDVKVVQDTVYPSYFACPNVVGRDCLAGLNSGAAFVNSPWAKVSVANPGVDSPKDI